MGVVVEPRLKLAAAAVAWEAATKRQLALSLFSLDERPTAGAGVAAAVITGAGIAAASQVLLLLVWASQEQKEVVAHQSGHNPSDRAFAG